MIDKKPKRTLKRSLTALVARYRERLADIERDNEALNERLHYLEQQVEGFHAFAIAALRDINDRSYRR